MIEFALICLTGFTLGLYAGKRRANGKGWGEIAKESVGNAYSLAHGAWQAVSKQFRKDMPDTVDAERKVQTMDNKDKFVLDWKEIQPGVETTYEAGELEKGDDEE